jgi:hypothetical protein
MTSIYFILLFFYLFIVFYDYGITHEKKKGVEFSYYGKIYFFIVRYFFSFLFKF